tara:strand:+ start:256 stop:1329 length:1074 start_codon:yes stop_codon:yes gene_type:complete
MPGHYGGSSGSSAPAGGHHGNGGGGSSTSQGPAGGASSGGNYGGDSSGGYSDQERGAAQAPTPVDTHDEWATIIDAPEVPKPIVESANEGVSLLINTVSQEITNPDSDFYSGVDHNLAVAAANQAASDLQQREFIESGDFEAGIDGHEFAPVTPIETIHGETDDPDSVSYDPTYDPAKQETATMEAAFGTGEKAGDYRWNPDTQSFDRRTDYTFKEHWDRAPESIHWSPTLRLLWATGSNLSEGFPSIKAVDDVSSGEGGGEGAVVTPNSISSSTMSTSENTTYTSPAATWFAGMKSPNNQTLAGFTPFNLSAAYAAAKANVAQTLSTPSPIGWAAVNNTSPFYNFLHTNSLNKGII